MLVTGFQADPPPFPSPDGDFNPLLIDTLPQVLNRDPPWPPDSHDVPETVFDKGLKFCDDPLSQPLSLRPTYRRKVLT